MRSLHAILPRVEGEIGFVLTSRSQGHTPSAEVAEGDVPEFALAGRAARSVGGGGTQDR
jgi:hypothetical protein